MSVCGESQTNPFTSCTHLPSPASCLSHFTSVPRASVPPPTAQYLYFDIKNNTSSTSLAIDKRPNTHSTLGKRQINIWHNIFCRYAADPKRVHTRQTQPSEVQPLRQLRNSLLGCLSKYHPRRQHRNTHTDSLSAFSIRSPSFPFCVYFFDLFLSDKGFVNPSACCERATKGELKDKRPYTKYSKV